MLKKIGFYGLLMLLFWVPFYFLTRHQVFSENAVLIATVISIIPLLFLFVPAFQRLLENISSFKIGGFEVGFQKTVQESIYGSVSEQVTLDAGRQVVYGKAGLREFIALVDKFLPSPTTRLVVSIDLKDSESIYLPMLYFQARHLKSLFDLRAFLFIDSMQEKPENRILGTIPTWRVFEILEGYIGELKQDFFDAREKHQDLLREGKIEEYMYKTWNSFKGNLQGIPESQTLSRGVYRTIFADYSEKNVISYPLTEGEYAILYSYLEPDPLHNHLILVQEDKVVNVRTIDRVAREIVQGVLSSAITRNAPKNHPTNGGKIS